MIEVLLGYLGYKQLSWLWLGELYEIHVEVGQMAQNNGGGIGRRGQGVGGKGRYK